MRKPRRNRYTFLTTGWDCATDEGWYQLNPRFFQQVPTTKLDFITDLECYLNALKTNAMKELIRKKR